MVTFIVTIVYNMVIDNGNKFQLINFSPLIFYYCIFSIAVKKQMCVRCKYINPSYLLLEKPLMPKQISLLTSFTEILEILLNMEIIQSNQLIITIERFRILVYKLYFSYFSYLFLYFLYIFYISFIFLCIYLNFDNDTIMICDDALQGQQI